LRGVYLNYRLNRRGHRIDRRWERREATYKAVDDQLLIIMDRTKKLADQEDAEADMRPTPYTPPEIAQIRATGFPVEPPRSTLETATVGDSAWR
jgi:hypothetical protein